MTSGASTEESLRPTGPEPMAGWLCFLVGVASAALGLLPWLVTGMRLPLQNLWAGATASGQMPRVMLPFSQYATTFIVGLIVTGAATAGVFARAVRSRLPRPGFLALFLGVLAVQISAVLQTEDVVRAGLQDRRESALYLAALVTGATLSVLLGALVLWLIARAPRAGAVVGLSIAAVAAGPWLSGLLFPWGAVSSGDVGWQLAVLHWVRPVLVGAAVAWGGINTVGRVVAAAAGLVLLWVGSALTTAIASAAGTRVLARDPAAMLQYGTEVFAAALTTPGVAWPPVGVAVVVAAVGLVGRRLTPRRSTGRDADLVP